MLKTHIKVIFYKLAQKHAKNVLDLQNKSKKEANNMENNDEVKNFKVSINGIDDAYITLKETDTYAYGKFCTEYNARLHQKDNDMEIGYINFLKKQNQISLPERSRYCRLCF